jgi:probable O-glycosylation ligase (exosortase A-associated)
VRDALLLILLIIATIWALRSPWIGAMAWTNVSLMSPHMQFGYAAAGWPVATGLAICTMLGALATKDRQNPFCGAPVWWTLAFTIWVCITLPFSMYFDASYLLWLRSMKIYLMLFVTLALINSRRKLQVFIWVIVISICYYGVKGGVFTLATGGNYRVWGPGGFIEGNNEIALAVITAMPLLRYLQQQMTDKRAILAMTASMALCAVTALGTQSRGGLLGLMAMIAFLWLKGKSKLVWGVVFLAVGSLALSLMPEEWWQRMETIQSYQADASAMGRINAWWMAFNLAKDNIFGGGFVAWEMANFRRYAPVPDDVHVAHSIYFQVLGEHGFLGLFIFLAIGGSTWMAAHRLIRTGRQSGQNWAVDLGAMVQVSMIGYATTGAFLSLAYYDLPYDVMAIAVIALRLVRNQEREVGRPTIAGNGRGLPDAREFVAGGR